MTGPDNLTRDLITRNLAALWLPPEPEPPSEAELLRRVGEDAAELLRHMQARRLERYGMLEGER